MSRKTILWAIVIGVVSGLLVEWIIGRARKEA